MRESELSSFCFPQLCEHQKDKTKQKALPVYQIFKNWFLFKDNEQKKQTGQTIQNGFSSDEVLMLQESWGWCCISGGMRSLRLQSLGSVPCPQRGARYYSWLDSLGTAQLSCYSCFVLKLSMLQPSGL